VGLAGYLSGSSVVLYASTYNDSPSYLEQFTDPLEGGSVSSTDGTEITLATAATDDSFRGVALAPGPVPEPATLGLLAAGALGLFVRPKRKA
jgi:hypothetical protein